MLITTEPMNEVHLWLYVSKVLQLTFFLILIFSLLCGFKNYPYLPQSRDISFEPPPPTLSQALYINT